MARLPDELVDRIKREVALADLCTEYGIELSGSGKNLLGKCPFHEDDEPSFAVTPSKNLWNCLAGCGGGDNIKLVMNVEKVSFRRAAEKLAAKLGIVPEADTVTTHTGTTHEILTDPGDGLSDSRLMGMVTDFYHATFLNQPQAMAYLQKRKCFHPEAAKRFRIGYANRTLGYRVPKTTKAGQDLKAQLTKLGIYGEKGHEHLNGSVVFPVFDRNGNAVQMYGRKVNDHLRKGTPMHLYLQQPKRGIWNREGIEKQAEWLLCESILDALTLWCHGFRNVTTAFGVNGFNADLWKLAEEVKPTRASDFTCLKYSCG
jgi:DNA primase